jgi:hypothetical protein
MLDLARLRRHYFSIALGEVDPPCALQLLLGELKSCALPFPAIVCLARFCAKAMHRRDAATG